MQPATQTAPTDQPVAARPGVLRGLVMAGVAWSAGTSVVVQIARLGAAIALARFLTPAEYGLAAMALVISALVLAFADLSLGVGLVQRTDITEEDRSTVFWTSLAVGLVLTMLGLAASGLLAAFYREPRVQPLFAALSLNFTIASLGATHAALLHRAMDFRAIGIRVGASSIAGGGVGVILAASGFGAWALVFQDLTVTLVSTVVLWFTMPWRPTRVYSLQSLRELGSFGSKMLGTRLAEYLRTNGDRLLIGRVLGSGPLGTYSVGVNILLSPISRFVIAVTDTLFPAMSRLQGDREQVASVWLRATTLLAAAFVPALAGLAVVAHDFVPVALGTKWSAVAPLLQIMAIGAIAQVVTAPGAEVLKALGQPNTLLRIVFIETTVLLLAVLVSLPWGIVGVAVAYSLACIPTRVYFVTLVARSVKVPPRRLLAAFTGVGQAVLGLIVITLAVSRSLAGVSPAVRLAVVVASGIAAYVPLCLWCVPSVRTELSRISIEGVRRLRGSRVT